MKLVLTILVISNFLNLTVSGQICNIYCDGRDPSTAVDTRIPVTVEVNGRLIELHVDDLNNMAFAVISGGQPGDEVWIDRSMNGGITWDGPLGTSVSEGLSTQTLMFNVDNPKEHGLGAIRTCGRADQLIHCTDWARSYVNSVTEVDAAATALMLYYNTTTLWATTGWWNGANCFTAILDYIRLTGRVNYKYVIEGVFENNKDREDGNFTNMFIDDTLWWGLAWLDAYDVTGNETYLEMAMFDAEYSYNYTDDLCGGGIYWTTRLDHKNAIPNELFIKLAASLHNRIPGDTRYLSLGLEVWNWFNASGMINSENLVNDGLNTHSDCKNNGDVTWTYNQGVILGGLVELHIATGEVKFLDQARKIADAVLNSTRLIRDGILFEYGCEGPTGDCGGDGPTFKGVFVRNLGELDRHLFSLGQGRPYQSWLASQAKSNWDNNRNSLNQFGLHWAGPYVNSKAQACNLQSAFETFIAAM